ncbi:hypothetical protein EV363DRAFT_1421744 [Boletus edulis]|nr:hypothetical protein EV363DRAFT_1421744 [Boletus edulis]
MVGCIIPLDHIHARNYRRDSDKIIDDRQCVTGVKRQVPSVQQRKKSRHPMASGRSSWTRGQSEFTKTTHVHRNCMEKAWVNVVDLDPRGTVVSHLLYSQGL